MLENVERSQQGGSFLIVFQKLSVVQENLLDVVRRGVLMLDTGGGKVLLECVSVRDEAVALSIRVLLVLGESRKVHEIYILHYK